MSTRPFFRSALVALTSVALACSGDRPTPTEVAGTATDAAVAAVQSPIQVRVAPTTAVYRGSEAVRVMVTLSNPTRAAVLVPRLAIPEAELDEALFTVTRDGVPVPYVGPHVKRGATQAVELVRLEAGASLAVVVDLSGAYDLSRDGTYAVSYDSRGAHGARETTLRSPATAFTLTERTATVSAYAAPFTSTAAVALTYTNCTATQQSQLVTAVASATTYAQQASGYFAVNTAATARYTKWFGIYTASNFSTVKAHFAAIQSAFETQPVTIDCRCKKTYYAYVYPSQPYKIYVCSAFWKAPLTGTDSKAGTLIHEMSHFTVVAGTDDWAYGQSAAASLAISDPLKAIDNADSHEYFAENTPILN